MLRTSAFTDGEMLAYEKYWLDVSTEKSALEKERKEGRAEGRAEGIAEGEKNKAIDIARNLKAAGLDFNFIAQNTGLTTDEISNL